MQIRPVEVPKRKPVLQRVLAKVHRGDETPLPAEHVDALRQGCVAEERVAHAPGDEEAGGVGEDLDAGADFADGGGGFEDGDGVAGEGDGDSGGETAEAGADDDCLRRERGSRGGFRGGGTFSWTGDLLIAVAELQQRN